MNCNKNSLKEYGFNLAYLTEKLDKPYVIDNAYIQNCKQPLLEALYKIAIILNIAPKYLINSTIK